MCPLQRAVDTYSCTALAIPRGTMTGSRAELQLCGEVCRRSEVEGKGEEDFTSRAASVSDLPVACSHHKAEYLVLLLGP